MPPVQRRRRKVRYIPYGRAMIDLPGSLEADREIGTYYYIIV